MTQDEIYDAIQEIKDAIESGKYSDQEIFDMLDRLQMKLSY